MAQNFNVRVFNAKCLVLVSSACFVLGCDSDLVTHRSSSQKNTSQETPGSEDNGKHEVTTPNVFVFKMDQQNSYESWSLKRIEKTTAGWQLTQQPIAESGTVSLENVIDQGHFVRQPFRQTYQNPVVLSFVSTRNGSEPVQSRIRHVHDEFHVFMQEPGGGQHTDEKISYLVVESGEHRLTRDFIITAGLHRSSKVHHEGDSYNGDRIDFRRSQSQTPVVLSELNTYNNADFMSSHIYNIDKSGFSLVQEAAGSGSVAVEEDLAWVALSPGHGVFNGVQYEIGYGEDGVNNGVSDSSYLVDFIDFLNFPNLIIGLQTAFGTDGAWVRSADSNQPPWDYHVYAEEDQVKDSEQSHINEVMGWVGFSENAELWAYHNSGYARSHVFAVDGVAVLGTSQLTWTWQSQDSNGHRRLRVYVRVSKDKGSSWSSWSEVFQNGALPELNPGDNLTDVRLQIQTNLSTADRQRTPRLSHLTLTITPSS